MNKKENKQKNKPKEMVKYNDFKAFMKDEEGDFLDLQIYEKNEIFNFIKDLKEKIKVTHQDIRMETGMSQHTLSKMEKEDVIITAEGKKRLAFSIVSAVPQLNVHLRNKMDASDKHKDEANEYDLDRIKNLRKGFIAAFGPIGKFLVKEDLDIKYIRKILMKYYNLYSAIKL